MSIFISRYFVPGKTRKTILNVYPSSLRMHQISSSSCSVPPRYWILCKPFPEEGHGGFVFKLKRLIFPLENSSSQKVQLMEVRLQPSSPSWPKSLNWALICKELTGIYCLTKHNHYSTCITGSIYVLLAHLSFFVYLASLSVHPKTFPFFSV